MLCTAAQNKGIFTACEYSFEINPFCIYLSIKDLDILAEFRLSQILHLCTQNSVCATNFGPFGEIGANFPVQLSSRSQFANIENKIVIADCEKHKNQSLALE